jgi:lipoyl(octanoyl) transferase
MSKNNFLVNFDFRSELVGFEEAVEFMQQKVDKIINQDSCSLIWLIEHPKIYTAGISSKKDEVKDNSENEAEDENIKKNQIPIFYTNRGGKITYHAPKMKIIYLMIDVKKLFYPKKPDISIFVEFLENWVIEILAEFGIIGLIRKNRVGIWVIDENGEEKKIAAIGIKLKKYVSYHGIAINIDPDLSGFDYITPCGISDYGVTSMAKFLKKEINFSNEDFLKIVKNNFFKAIEKMQLNKPLETI